jgi:hypothetical protein
MFRRSAPGLLSLAFVLTACGGADSPATVEWSGTVTDSAGIQVVTNPLTPIWGEGDAWTLEEVLTIGEAAGRPEYQFGQITGIGVASDGRVLVSDTQGQHLKVFSPDGIWERTIGEPGSGPGQFGQQIGPVLVGRGDTIIVPDITNQRANLITPDGESLGSLPVDMQAGIPIRWEMRNDGAIVAQLRQLIPPSAGPPDTVDVIVAQGYGGAISDTLAAVASGKTFSMSAAGQPEFHFFSPEPIWALTGDGGMLLGTNDEYRFVIHGPDGTASRIVSIPSEPAVVTDEDRSLFVSALESLWGEAGVPPQGIQQLKSGISFEDHFSGTLWVQRIRPLSQMSAEEKESFNPLQNIGSARWDVFDAEGRYLGIVEMPFHYQPLGFHGNDVLGVWRDDLDVQYVKVLRIAGMA